QFVWVLHVPGRSESRGVSAPSPGIASDRLSHRRSDEVLRFPSSSERIRTRERVISKVKGLPLFPERLRKRLGADVSPCTRQDTAKSARFQCRSCFRSHRWGAWLSVRE